MPAGDTTYNYKTPYQIPGAAQKILPNGLGQDFFDTIDKNLQQQESKQMEDLLGFQESRGLMQSGNTNEKLVTDVLGPGEQRRQAAELPLIMGAAQTGQAQDFAREQTATQYQDNLNLMIQKASLDQDLLRLRAQLENNSGSNFMSTFMSTLGSGLGGAAAGAAGGPAGMAAGAGLGMLKSLFANKSAGSQVGIDFLGSAPGTGGEDPNDISWALGPSGT